MAWYCSKLGITFPINLENIYHPMQGNWYSRFSFGKVDFPLDVGSSITIFNNSIDLTYIGIIRKYVEGNIDIYVHVTGRSMEPLAPMRTVRKSITLDAAFKSLTKLSGPTSTYTKEELEAAKELLVSKADLNTTTGTRTFAELQINGDLSRKTYDLIFPTSNYHGIGLTSSSEYQKVKELQSKLKMAMHPAGYISVGSPSETLDIEEIKKDNIEYKDSYVVIELQKFKFYSNIQAIEYRDSDMVVWL